MEHFPCDKSNGDKNKTIHFNIQWEEIYSPQWEVHKTINEHILSKWTILRNAMYHYEYIVKEHGKAELEELIYSTIFDISKTNEGWKLIKFINEQMIQWTAMDAFIRIMTIQDKVIYLSKVRKWLIGFKSDIKALLTMFDIKTAECSDLDIFYMTKDVLIGALCDQLRKYTDSYKVFKSIEMNTHLISFGPTFLESDPSKWFMDIMGVTNDTMHWGRNLFNPCHYKREDVTMVLREKAGINR